MEPHDFENRYSFPLDEFQREAIGKLNRDRSVLVAAPTGSGKTVIAEYALEQALEKGLKFFYTTPLKALSNQKYRDLSGAYSPEQVGLLTGDNSINGEAPVVVMTTEVLRNMIYENSPLLNTLGVVVLDEVHYMQDPARGAVWEEIVILLPHHVRLVALSATVSNAADLADWMKSLRGGVDLVLAGERPVKLKNFYFVGRALAPLFAKNLPRVIEEQLEALKRRPARAGGRARRGGADLRPKRTDAVRELAKRDMLPAIYFLFSRAACQDSVTFCLRERLRLNSPAEERAVAEYLEEKVQLLDSDDLDLLDYDNFASALKMGVAAHHAGALPLFKEAVEELFATGLIKVVFATETLSLGINMPARSVIIESLSKWTGEAHRPLMPGEYKQLTGRAGRRGIDEIGYSIVLYQKFFSLEAIRTLVNKEPHPVVSRFEVSYNMAVNILAEHDLAEAQRLLNLSFAQYSSDKRVVTLEARLETLDEDLAREMSASACPEADATRYRQQERALSQLQRRLATLSKERKSREITGSLAELKPGDVFVMGGQGALKVMAVVKKHHGRKEEDAILAVDPNGRYRRISARSMKTPPRRIGAVDVARITSPAKKVRKQVGIKMESLYRKSEAPDEPEKSADEVELGQAIEDLSGDLSENRCSGCAHRPRCLEAARKVEKISKQMENATKERDSGYDVVSKRLVDVVELLNRYAFMDGAEVTDKGGVLRRIYNECDLLLVEALDGHVISRLDPAELAAFASWFIYESRDGETEEERNIARSEEEHYQGELGYVLEWLNNDLASMKISEGEMGLDLLGSPDTGFSEAAHMWASGAELQEMLRKYPDRSIGDMVRTMKQIIDLLRQLAEVSSDPYLKDNLRRAMDAIDRGVVGYSSIESIIEHVAPGL